MTLPAPDDLHAYVNSLFSPLRRQAALEWAATPEGREVIDSYRAELHALPKPVTP